MNNWENILIAVDGGETSERAVRYVGNIASLIKDVRICLLHVYPEPPPDFYGRGGRLHDYQRGRIEIARELLQNAALELKKTGVPMVNVSTRTCMAEGKTISEVVLEIQAEGKFGTVVTGKRGVSKAEEFLFGSISNALARHSKNFTSWIVG